MYSVVLMMAMTGPDAPAGLFHKHNSGCCGCQGYAASSCGGEMACGCQGGGGRGGLFHKNRGHGGCMGGCGGYSAGCGCCGQMASCGCGQSMGCYGGGMMAGCGCGQSMGCYGGGMMMGGYGMPMGGAPATGPAPGTGVAPGAKPPTTPPPMGGGFDAPASLVVNLPADATLKIDGTATKATSTVRQFTTPVLARGESYNYTLTAEIVRDGQTYSATQTVAVRAGQTSQVELPASAFGTAVAAK